MRRYDNLASLRCLWARSAINRSAFPFSVTYNDYDDDHDHVEDDCGDDEDDNVKKKMMMINDNVGWQ